MGKFPNNKKGQAFFLLLCRAVEQGVTKVVRYFSIGRKPYDCSKSMSTFVTPLRETPSYY